MASAAALWNYQRKLSFTGSPNEGQRGSVQLPTRRATRTESEGSVTSFQNDDTEERRDSATSNDSTDDEALDHGTNRSEKSKGRRRFSLDFLFSRKGKDKSRKSQKDKRSQSTVSAFIEDNDNQRMKRYPRLSGAEYALAI